MGKTISEKEILFELLFINLIFLTLMVIVTPFSTFFTSLGLFIVWKIIRVLPIFVSIASGIRELFLSNQKINFSKALTRPFFRKLADIILIQVAYYIVLIFFLINLGTINSIGAMLLEWFDLLDFSSIINSPQQTFNFFVDWLNLAGIPSIGIFLLPPIVASFGVTLISIPCFYLLGYIYSNLKPLIQNKINSTTPK